MHKVFVYGTLKRGHSNHELLRDSEYLGEFHTGPGYIKLNGPGFPFLVKYDEGEGCYGELFNVTDLTLELLDRLEGHPNLYVRILITVQGSNGPVKAFVYLFPEERL